MALRRTVSVTVSQSTEGKAQTRANTGTGGSGRPDTRPSAEIDKFLMGSFELQFTPNPDTKTAFVNPVQHDIHRYLDLPITVKPELISREEVCDRLLQLKLQKVPAPNGVENTALRVLPELLLLGLFNICLKLTYFPLKLKKV